MSPTSGATAAAAPVDPSNPLSQLAAAMGAGPGSGAGAANPMGMPSIPPEFLNSPLVQSLLSNPEMVSGEGRMDPARWRTDAIPPTRQVRSLMESNPTMRQLQQNNPDLYRAMTDPDTLRQALRIASNPSLMQEQMRSMDR